MDISIDFPDIGSTATRAEVIDNHTDVIKMLMTIYVGLFNASGDRLKVIIVDHHINSFPIPSIDEQLEIVKPAIEALKQQSTPVIE